MGVYIKGMEMPKTCRECVYCWVGLKSCDAKYGLPVGDRWDIERASFCPLTEVPEPHGRLIDADAELIDAIKTTINELPSAEDVSREDYHNLLTALDDVDRALRQYQAKYENQSTDDNWMEKVFQEKLGIETANEILSSEEELGNWIERMLWHVEHIDHDNWIPVSERLPDELAAVNITWVNHNPPPYYKYTKDVPLVDSAVYYRGKWYWWDATVIDLLGEYDGAYIHGIEPIDKDIEVVAWMPLPTPYREENEE